MKFELSVESLRKALSVCQVPAGSSLASFSNRVMIEGGKEGVFVSATDGSLYAVMRVNGPGSSFGRCMMPIDTLSSICREIPADEAVQFELADDKVKVRADGGSWTVANEVKPMPTVVPPSGQRLKLTETQLGNAVSWTGVAASKDGEKFGGALLEFGGGEFLATGTDGRRLSFYRVPHDYTGKTLSARVPTKLMKMAQLLGSDVEISVEGSMAYFFADCGFVAGLQMDGGFPKVGPFLKVFKDSPLCTALPESLASAVRRVQIVSDVESQRIEISHGEGGAIFQSRSNNGEAISVCPVDNLGDELVTGSFSGEFLGRAASMLATLGKDPVDVGMFGPGKMFLRRCPFAHIIVGMEDVVKVEARA